MLRVFMIFVCFYYYLYSVINLFNIMSAAFLGNTFFYNVSLANTVTWPIVYIIIMFASKLKHSAVLMPMFKISLLMYVGTQAAVYVVTKGLITNDSIMAQMLFLVASLLIFFATRLIISLWLKKDVILDSSY